MTPAEAQGLQDAARARGRWLMWFVARAHTAAHGGAWLPDVLAADTLDTLRAMLPRGLTRHDRTSAMSPEVVEVWD